MAKKRFRIKDSQGNVVPYDVAAEDVTMADGRSVEAGKASLKAVAGFLDPAHFPIVMLYNVAPFTSTPDYSSIPVGIVYLDESLTAPYKRLYYKKSVEGTAQSIDLGAPKDGVIYFHQSTGKLYRWVATSQGNDGSFTQIGILGINDIPGLADAIAAAGTGAVTVTTSQDGTFTIHVGDDDYIVSLNHTHENMAKLIVCEESDLPSTLDEDTIYGVEDSGEIAMLYVGGLPFYGGGGGVSTPVLRKPIDGSTIDVGRIASGDSSVEHTIEIKGRNLTQALAVAVTGTGFSIKNGVSSISAADANVGTTITIVCTSSSEDAAGELSIASSEVSCDCDLISNKSTYEDLSGVKMNGAQWLLTDYYPNPNTELLLKVHFERNSNSMSSSANDLCGILLSCELGESNKKFMIYTSRNATSSYQYGNHNLWLYNSNGVRNGNNDLQTIDFANSTDAAKFIADGLQIQYTKGSSNGVLRALDAGDNVLKSVNTTLHGVTQENPLRIGIGRVNDTQTETLYAMFDVTIKSFTITENGTTVRNWVPKLKNGTVAGLYDTVNDTFISSQTATGLVAVQ